MTRSPKTVIAEPRRRRNTWVSSRPAGTLIGLAGWNDHTAKETADLRTLPMLTKRAALLL